EKEPGLLSSQVEEVAPEAPAQAMPRPEPDQPLVALEDITEYGISVPEVSLIPEGLSGGPLADETPPPQMTEEVATGSEVATPAEEVEQPPPAEESGQSSVSPKKEKPKPEESAAVKKEEEKKPEEGKKPEEKKPKARPAEPVYTFSVYAGVYDSEVEANRQRDRLIELGFQSTISVRSQGEKKEYALQVGSSLEEYEPAEAVKNRLREAGFPQAIVLRRETR
ncbi:MAG: hypothetical protein A2Y63_06450, partial [Candidatus Riflebacteria bacterium RBG_13_59_9]